MRTDSPSEWWVLPTKDAGAAASKRAARRARRRAGGKYALIALALAYVGVLLVAPLWSLAAELFRLGGGAVWAALSRPEALTALGVTVQLTAIAAVVNAVVGVIGGWVLVRDRFWARGAFNALVDLPLAVSPVMVGLGFLLLLGRGGLLEPLAEALGVRVLFAFPGLVLATLFVTLPYTLREVAYVLSEAGDTEEQAAATLGASPWQTFYRVTLPLLRPGLVYGVLMTVARSLGEFGAVLVLGGSIAGETQTATTFIHDALEERDAAGAYGMASLLALGSTLLMLALDARKRKLKAERSR